MKLPAASCGELQAKANDNVAGKSRIFGLILEKIKAPGATFTQRLQSVRRRSWF